MTISRPLFILGIAVAVWALYVAFGILLTLVQCLCWRVERWWFKRSHTMAHRKEEL